MKSSLAIVALVATTIGLGTALPAFAQAAPPAPPAATSTTPDDQNTPHRMMQRGMGQHRMAGPGRGMGPQGMGPAGLLMLACSDKGSEALEIALVRMSHRLELTADQQTLFDTFRTKALTTETSFADSCKASRPDHTADVKPDALARLKAGLAIDQARLTAMNDVLPDFEALFNSLSDKQKADLLPHRDWGMGRGAGRPGDHGGTPPAPQHS